METISVVYHDVWHLFLYLFFAHVIGDFLLQSEKLIIWKEKSKKGVAMHVGILFIVNVIVLFPYLFMLEDSGHFAYMWLGIIAIYVLHFLIDVGKIALTKKHPERGLQFYLGDQFLHIAVIAVAAYILQPFLGVEMKGEFLGEMYFAKDLVLYFIALIVFTYAWEVTRYMFVLHKAKLAQFSHNKSKKAKKKLPLFEPRMRAMMLRGIAVSLVYMFLMPFVPTAYGATGYFVGPDSTAPDGIILDVQPRVFAFGDEVTIIGNGFGDEMTEYSQVCWSTFCINKASITKWSDQEIKFKMNVVGMPSQGQLHVVKLNSSGMFIEDIDGKVVTVLPKIDKFYDEHGNKLSSLTSGQTVTLTGYYLGTSTNIMKLDNQFVHVIDSWAQDEITFEVPDLPAPTSTVYVERKNGSNTTVDIKGNAGLSNDPFSHLQSYLFNTYVHMAWEKYDARGEGIVVAVLDNGVSLDHVDLQRSLWKNENEIPRDGIDNDGNGFIDDYDGYDFVNDTFEVEPYGDHGTLVAGVIAAQADNLRGIAGIAPKAKIMSLTVCKDVSCSGQAVDRAVRYAVDNGADIINMSLTGLGDNPSFDEDLDRTMQYAYDHGVFIVVAAGNGNQELAKAQKYYGRNFDENPISPVCNDGTANWVIGVASIASNLSNSVFSDYGSNCIDISAYGEKVYSTSIPIFSEDGGEYEQVYGTSFATPQVSGALALALSEFPRASYNEVRSALVTSGMDIDPNLALEFKGHFGKGLNILIFLDELAGVETVFVTRDDSESGEVAADGEEENLGLEITPPSGEGFADLGSVHPSYTAITFLTDQGILEGYEDGTFKPSQTVNRAELLKILVAGQGIDPDPIRYRNCFDDVKEEWFARYVCYAKKEGWVEGYTDGTFRPSQTVNKVEALKMMIEGYAIELDEEEETFADVAGDDWFAPYVARAQKLGLLQERGALFNPGNGKTRASISENIFRILLVKDMEVDTYDKDLVHTFLERCQPVVCDLKETLE